MGYKGIGAFFNMATMNEQDYFEQFIGDVDKWKDFKLPFTLEELTALAFDEQELRLTLSTPYSIPVFTWVHPESSYDNCPICKNK